MRVLPATLLTLMFVMPLGIGSAEPAEGCTDTIDPETHRDGAIHVDPLFSDLFPTQALLVTQDWSRLPTIPEFWATGPNGACRIDDLPTLLERTDTTLGTEKALQNAAWLIAQTTDEATLGLLEFESFDAVVPTGDGALVTLTATSEQTGMRIEYVVDVDHDGTGAATWTATEVVPGLRQNWEGWFLGIGQSGPFEPTDGLDATALFPTHDGKEIRINYNPNSYPDAIEAAEDVERNGVGGVLAYDTMNRDWGFPSDDPDNFLDITLDGCACIYGGNNVNIHMPPNLQAWIAAIIPGLWYPDEDGVVYDVIGHEFFHHFQYSIMEWNAQQYVIEGTARFIETAYTPEYSHVPGSLHWLNNINGFSYLASNPHLAPASHWYSYGLFWGHLYDTNGGVEIIKRVLEESAINNGLPGFIDRALLTDGVEHTSYVQALGDFGARLAARDMVWDRHDGSASYDWLAYAPQTPIAMPAVGNTGAVATSSWNPNVAAFALRIAEFGHAGATDTAVFAVASGPEFTGRLVSTTDGETTVTDVTGPGAAVDTASDTRMLVMARGLPSPAPVNTGAGLGVAQVHVAFA